MDTRPEGICLPDALSLQWEKRHLISIGELFISRISRCSVLWAECVIHKGWYISFTTAGHSWIWTSNRQKLPIHLLLKILGHVIKCTIFLNYTLAKQGKTTLSLQRKYKIVYFKISPKRVFEALNTYCE